MRVRGQEFPPWAGVFCRILIAASSIAGLAVVSVSTRSERPSWHHAIRDLIIPPADARGRHQRSAEDKAAAEARRAEAMQRRQQLLQQSDVLRKRLETIQQKMVVHQQQVQVLRQQMQQQMQTAGNSAQQLQQMMVRVRQLRQHHHHHSPAHHNLGSAQPGAAGLRMRAMMATVASRAALRGHDHHARHGHHHLRHQERYHNLHAKLNRVRSEKNKKQATPAPTPTPTPPKVTTTTTQHRQHQEANVGCVAAGTISGAGKNSAHRIQAARSYSSHCRDNEQDRRLRNAKAWRAHGSQGGGGQESRRAKPEER